MIDPDGKSSEHPKKPKKPGGHTVTLGGSGMNTNDPQYRQLVKTAIEKNKKNSQKAPPLITGTATLTKGSYGAKAKVLGVGAEYSSSSNETDIVGFRDNKNVLSGEKKYKNGMSASVAGVGGGVTIESDKPMSPNGTLPDKYAAERKISAPFITAVSKTEDGDTYTGFEHEFISAKITFLLLLQIQSIKYVNHKYDNFLCLSDNRTGFIVL